MLSTGTWTISHAGGTCRAVCVQLVMLTASENEPSDFAYGGVALTQLREDLGIGDEGGKVITYWADNVPTGTQNLVGTSNGTNHKRLTVSTMSSGAGTTIGVDSSNLLASANTANPTFTLATSAATNTVIFEAGFTGLQTITSTPATGWTLQAAQDPGSFGFAWARNTGTGGNVTCGWQASTVDDWVLTAIAFKEVSGAVTYPQRASMVVPPVPVISTFVR